jgi:hypothetical protein
VQKNSILPSHPETPNLTRLTASDARITGLRILIVNIHIRGVLRVPGLAEITHKRGQCTHALTVQRRETMRSRRDALEGVVTAYDPRTAPRHV